MIFQVAASTMQVQGVVNFFFYIILGMVALIVFVWLLFALYTKLTYNYHVFIYKKVGDTEIVFEDQAKQVKLQGNYMMHFRKMRKYAPIVDQKFMRIVQKPLLGIIPNSKIGFNAYLYGETLFPLAVKPNPGLEPINLDMFNYMQSRIQANQQKYVARNALMQLLPYVALGGVILMFIVGMIFYTKHVENIAKSLIGLTESSIDQIIEAGGPIAQQVKPA